MANAVTRRGLLGHTFGAYTAVALGAGIHAEADPFLVRMDRMKDEILTFDFDDLDQDSPSEAVGTDLASGRLRIETKEGAAEALRYVLDDGSIVDTLSEKMVRAALAFLDRSAA